MNRIDRALRGPRFVAAAVVCFVALTTAVTWPQARHLSDGVSDIGDPLLNTWAMAWVAHQLPYAPAHVFDANIFHPERGTLAYSETLLAPALLGAPLQWLGAGPILVYNLLLFAGTVASGLGTALVVHALTGRRSAALVAGAAFICLPFRADHDSHFQLLQTQWMPMALWFLHRLVERGGLRDGAGLGLAVGLQVMTSVYNAIFLAVFLAAIGPVLLWRAGLSLARVRALGAGVLVAGVLAAPVAQAHLSARAVVGERSAEEARPGSARLSDYLAAPGSNPLHASRSERFGGHERRLYPGAVVAGLAVAALWPPLSAVRLAYGVGLVAAVYLSLGFNGPGYAWLYDHLFVLRSLRVPARMGLLAGLALSVLAGLGVARLAGRLSRAGVGALTAVLVAAIAADTWAGPRRIAVVPWEVPEVYADLMRHRGLSTNVPFVRRRGDPQPVVLLELPMSREDPTYMYYSTYHWQTLVNGYSGFVSSRHIAAGHILGSFPDRDAVNLMAGLGVRYVTLHQEFMRPGEYERLTGQLDRMAPEFRLVSRRPWKDQEISLYHFTPPSQP